MAGKASSSGRQGQQQGRHLFPLATTLHPASLMPLPPCPFPSHNPAPSPHTTLPPHLTQPCPLTSHNPAPSPHTTLPPHLTQPSPLTSHNPAPPLLTSPFLPPSPLADLQVVCYILHTANFCRETLEGLGAAIQKDIKPALAASVGEGGAVGGGPHQACTHGFCM